MTGLLTLLAAVAVFGTVVLVHELGHFLAARRCGIRVEEFSIGFGPEVWSRDTGETRYTLRLFPFGGYNMMAGYTEDRQDEEKQPALYRRDAPLFPAAMRGKTYPEASPWQRFFVIAAGAAMNFVAGFLVLIILTASQEILTSKVIYDFTEDAASYQSGLRPGDEIISVNGHYCFVIEDVIYELQRTKDYKADFVVLREGKRTELPGIQFSTVTGEDGSVRMLLEFRVYGVNPASRTVVREAGARFLYYARSILRSFTDLATGRTSVQDLSGPVGVVSAVSQAVQYGWRDVLSLAALLTINLGIFNLLPVPGLDGCKLWFLAFEGIAGREVPQRIQNGLNLAGMALLLWLMFFVTAQDISKFFS